jgi:hypothetical protein
VSKKCDRTAPVIPYLYRRKDGVVTRIDGEPICPERAAVKEEEKPKWTHNAPSSRPSPNPA